MQRTIDRTKKECLSTNAIALLSTAHTIMPSDQTSHMLALVYTHYLEKALL